MVRRVKALVVGSGPAGLTGAIAIAESLGDGKDVVIIDEGIEPGGQLPKANTQILWSRRILCLSKGV